MSVGPCPNIRRRNLEPALQPLVGAVGWGGDHRINNVIEAAVIDFERKRRRAKVEARGRAGLARPAEKRQQRQC